MWRSGEYDFQTVRSGDTKQALRIAQLFEGVNDVRCSGMIRYPLSEMLIICFSAVLANADVWVEIERFGKTKEMWLKTFPSLASRRSES